MLRLKRELNRIVKVVLEKIIYNLYLLFSCVVIVGEYFYVVERNV